MRTGGSLGCLEDVVELLLERSRFGEGPVRVLLVAENDVLQHALGDTKQMRDLLVNLGALGRDSCTL